ncbi:WD40 repeat domain-containing protein [Streptomyces sp. NPDC046931]|uniref:WD40 repeat domain-containing protein n=1 Tax=Streptomyces sp. NPDC046931 TaxID=3154806 RepID=UPI0033EBAC67
MVLSFGLPLERTEDGDSPRPGLDPLEHAPRHAANVAQAFRDFGYTSVEAHGPSEGSLGPDASFPALVDSALADADVDVLVVHVVGHGELAGGGSEQLYLLDRDGRRIRPPVGEWIDLIEDHPDEHRPMTLFILDVCHAGQAAVLSWHARMDTAKRRAWVLAATDPTDRAYDYRLSRALVSVLAGYASGQIRFDPSVRYIPAPAVWREIGHAVDRLWREADALEQRVGTSLVPSHADLSHLPFFPNPSYDPLSSPVAGLPPEIARLTDWADVDPEHFMRRAGGGEPVGRGWDKGYFSGRDEELDELSAWLDDPAAGPGLRVVTGKPGAGKSALLGILVCAAHPLLREHTEPLWRGLGERAPGRNERIAVVHARRLDRGQVVDSLGRQLRGMGGRADAAAPGERHGGMDPSPADLLLGMLPGDGPPVTVIIDALDEAIRPEEIASTVLLPLAQQSQAEGIRLRLLVGTRDDPRFAALQALARAQAGHTDLSAASPVAVRLGLTDYVNRLLATDDSPYSDGTRRPARNALARAIAERLTGRVDDRRGGLGTDDALQWGEFLTAGLYVHYLLAGEEPRATAEEAAALGRAVPRSLPALLKLDLRRRTVSPFLRPVLTALAFAQGRGMPESVLAHAAMAFTATGGDPIPWKQLQELLDGEARFYLRREVDEDGTALYRLFHEGLAEWLRDTPADRPAREERRTGPTGNGLLARAERLYERLADCVDRDVASRTRWDRAVPYLLRHIAQHAVDAGKFDGLVGDAEFLVHADPRSVADAAGHARSDQARLDAAVYRASWGVHHALPAGARRQLLALDAARFANTRLQADLPGDADWHVRWATGGQVSPALVRTLLVHDDATYAAAAVVAELDGRPHVIAGCDLGPVRVWDATSGALVRTLPHTGGVRSMAVAQLNGHPHVVISSGRSVDVWDLVTGGRAHPLAGQGGWVEAVAVVGLGGRPHLLAGGKQDRGPAQIRIWDLATGVRTHVLTGDWGKAAAMAVLANRVYAIVELGTGRREVRVWDAATGDLNNPLADQSEELDAVAVTELDGRPHAFTAGWDGQVRVWDLTTGACVRTLTGHTGRVHRAEGVHLDGRPHAFTADWDGQVRVWDLTTGACVRTLTGHTRRLHGVAVVHLGGRPHAVTTDWSGQTRIWDLASGTPSRALAGHTSQVTAMAVTDLDGRPHVITGGDEGDGLLRVWDLAAGTCVRSLPGPDRKVCSIAVTELQGRPHVIIGCQDSRAPVVELSAGTVSRTLTPSWAFSVAATSTTVAGRPHAVLGTWGREESEGLVAVWDLTTDGRPRTALMGDYGIQAIAVATLEDRPHAVTGSYGRDLRIWDLTPDRPTHVRTLTGHTGSVYAVAVTDLAGRPHAVTGSEDGSARVWDLAAGACVLVLDGHTDGVRAVAIAEWEGRTYAITGSDDASIRVWDLETGSCRAVFRLPDTCGAVAVGVHGTVAVGAGNEVVVLSLTRLVSLTPLGGRPR